MQSPSLFVIKERHGVGFDKAAGSNHDLEGQCIFFSIGVPLVLQSTWEFDIHFIISLILNR